MAASAQTRWKRAAIAAIDSSRFERERRNLARCLAGRMLQPRGQQAYRSLATIALQDRPRYETAIAGLLDDFTVRVSLAARRLQVLHESGMYCDYEDAALLAAEARWTRGFYESLFQCPVPLSPEWDQTRAPGERRSRSLDDFLGTLEATVVPHLHTAKHSAA